MFNSGRGSSSRSSASTNGKPAEDSGSNVKQFTNSAQRSGGRGAGSTGSTGGRRSSGSGWGARLGWIVTAAVVLLIVIPTLLAGMITDWMWFDSQSLADVYTTRLWLAIGVFFGGLALAAVLLFVNWTVTWRLARPTTLYEGQRDPLPLSPRLARWITIVAALAVALFFGISAAEEWPTILLYLNGGSFGATDPLFNNDIGFYVFSLPFFRLLRDWLMGIVIVAALGTLAIYAVGAIPNMAQRLGEIASRPGARPGTTTVSPSSVAGFFNSLGGKAGAHLSVLAALFLGLVSLGYWFDRFDLLYSSRAVAYGAGYSDVNAKLPALTIMMVIAGLIAVLLLVNIRLRAWKLLAGAFGAWLLALILISGVYPAIIQQFVVKPSESELERPYIVNNIASTRAAYGLDKFTEREVPAVDTITRGEVQQNANIVSNIRLWDYRPLHDTYAQLQEIRPYYSFGEPDIDRYTIGGKLQQVMLAARELNPDELAANVRTWENIHFRYTHGYGIVVSPVNEIVGEGLPNLLVRDIPPTTDIPELKLTRPEIYYGEQTDEYIFVNSSEIEEFDYPSGNENKFTRYAGEGGVEASSFFTKLLFAVRFGDGNILISPYITPGTRVIYHRNIHDMVRLLAPFLSYDSDPYVVAADGKLYWIQDAFTHTDKYPYSTPYYSNELGEINYIRNSVKVVIDAYSGKAVFYVSDPTDPMVRAYRGIFPQLFRDISEMPASIRSHVRYPEDLMNVQSRIYATFHMTDPQVFYTREDVWALPSGGSDKSIVAPEAYYVNMQLPGDAKQGFALIQPFTPNNKDNMIAWMAARNDGDDYGRVEVIRYPKQELVYGPRQIEARIDQDPVISQQLTLWSQSGSDVIRGNLLTIPISNTVLYVEPLFLQAANNTRSFPELKRVIVATGDSVGIGPDLATALDVAFKIVPGQVTGGGTPTPQTTPQPGQTVTPGTPGPTTGRSPAEIAQSANDHYDRAQQALRSGDWTTYGREMDAMKADLDELVRLMGTPVPRP